MASRFLPQQGDMAGHLVDKKLLALVVEDETNIRDLVCLHLGFKGYDCVAVCNGTEALQYANEKFLMWLFLI